MGALLIKGGQVICSSANMSRPFGKLNRGFHAEERLLKSQKNAKGATLVVVRLNKHKKPATMSRPCPKCWPLVLASGVKKVIYINWDGCVIVERIRYG